MGEKNRKFVAKGVPGGWKIWNKKANKWWGELYEKQPDDLLEELNGEKRPDVLVNLKRKHLKNKR